MNNESIPNLFEPNKAVINQLQIITSTSNSAQMATELNPTYSPSIKSLSSRIQKKQNVTSSRLQTLNDKRSSIDVVSIKTLSQQETTHIKVYARFRPLNKMEQDLSKNGLGYECSVFPDHYTVILQPDNIIYTFDKTFSTTASQQSIYLQVGKDAVEDVLNGYNGTIFAYGQTGSGKTYTMFGELRDDAHTGIIPRSMLHFSPLSFIRNSIFSYINSSENEFVLTCSMLEIYKETLYDLLSVNKSDLKIKENPQKGIYVENLTQLSLSGEEELLKIVELGEQTRKVAATRINQYSSRSHTIFMLEIKQKFPNESEKKGKLNLVDLAGSEKVGKTGAIGEILEEAKKINLSLSCLGNVIHAITTNNDHIPYRNSKLTRLLQESLGGNYKTSLIVTCSSHSSSMEETISTLKFAQRAKNIKNHFKMNVKVSSDMLVQVISELKVELRKTQLELEQMKKRSFIDIPNENAQQLKLYDTKTLSNQEKKCFKKKASVQTTITTNSSQSSESLSQLMNYKENNKSISIIPISEKKSKRNGTSIDCIDAQTPLSRIRLEKMNSNVTQQTSIDLSFFSVKKNWNCANEVNQTEIKLANEQLNQMKESEVHLIKQVEDIRSQLGQEKLENQKKSQKLMQLQCKVQNLESIIQKQQKQLNECRGKELQVNQRPQMKDWQAEAVERVRQLERELSQIISQKSIQCEYNQILVEENSFLNKQVELLSQFNEQDEYFNSLLRDKIETMNIEYFRKIDGILNNEINSSNITKIVTKSKFEMEDLVKSVSRENFINSVMQIVSREVQDSLKNTNPEWIKKTIKQCYDALQSSSSMIDSALVDFIQQYESVKIKKSEWKQQMEAFSVENSRMNQKILVQNEQITHLQTKNEKITELLRLQNLSLKQKLAQVSYLQTKISTPDLTTSPSTKYFRKDYYGH